MPTATAPFLRTFWYQDVCNNFPLLFKTVSFEAFLLMADSALKIQKKSAEYLVGK